jgi:hypothetical protein
MADLCPHRPRPLGAPVTDLSPAAQAVLDAMHRSYDHEPTRRAIAAEVLRRLADQVVPERPVAYGADYAAGAANEQIAIRDQLLTITAELEAAQ